jgi:hypothetical protein
VLRAVNGRDLWRVNLSAPRLLQPVPSGDFAVQTLCGLASEDQPAIGGLLVWQDQEHYLVLERGHWGAADIAFRGCLDNEDRYLGRGRLVSDQVWLRPERQGSRLRALCSADNQAVVHCGRSRVHGTGRRAGRRPCYRHDRPHDLSRRVPGRDRHPLRVLRRVDGGGHLTTAHRHSGEWVL